MSVPCAALDQRMVGPRLPAVCQPHLPPLAAAPISNLAARPDVTSKLHGRIELCIPLSAPVVAQKHARGRPGPCCHLRSMLLLCKSSAHWHQDASRPKDMVSVRIHHRLPHHIGSPRITAYDRRRHSELSC